MKSKIAYWYNHNIWDEPKVRMAVEKGLITELDYEEITGNKY